MMMVYLLLVVFSKKDWQVWSDQNAVWWENISQEAPSAWWK